MEKIEKDILKVKDREESKEEKNVLNRMPTNTKHCCQMQMSVQPLHQPNGLQLCVKGPRGGGLATLVMWRGEGRGKGESM